MPFIKLVSIICMQTDETDKDEIFLLMNNKKIWPEKSKFYAIDIDEEVSVNLQMEFSKGNCSIDLWEYDYIGSNEILGSFELEVGEKGSFSEMMTNIKGESSYILNYEVS